MAIKKVIKKEEEEIKKEEIKETPKPVEKVKPVAKPEPQKKRIWMH